MVHFTLLVEILAGIGTEKPIPNIVVDFWEVPAKWIRAHLAGGGHTDGPLVGTSNIGMCHFAFLVLSLRQGPSHPGNRCLIDFVLQVGQLGHRSTSFVTWRSCFKTRRSFLLRDPFNREKKTVTIPITSLVRSCSNVESRYYVGYYLALPSVPTTVLFLRHLPAWVISNPPLVERSAQTMVLEGKPD